MVINHDWPSDVSEKAQTEFDNDIRFLVARQTCHIKAGKNILIAS